MGKYDWKSNRSSGGVFFVASDGTEVVVAEGLGATRRIRSDRAAFIAKAVNQHDKLKAKLDDAVKIIEGLLPVVESRYCRAANNFLKKQKI